MLNSVARRSLDEDHHEIVSDEDQEGNLDCLLVPGDFVALVAANSTKKLLEVFVAKVLRLSEDKTLHILPILKKKSQEDLNRKREKVIRKIQVL